MIKCNNIWFREKTCRINGQDSIDINGLGTALYVVMTRKCNTECKFCEFHNNCEYSFNAEKFKSVFSWLNSFCNVHAVHFTGGEPTIELNKLKEVLKYIKSIDKNIKTSVNTNGTRLNDLAGIQELDNIALSRHDISDNDNQEIFGNKGIVPTTKEISEFADKRKIHLSCNLIKGHIDTEDKIFNFLEFASNIDINDIGFVSLMGVNKYCSDNFVDFESIEPRNNERLTKTRCISNISEVTHEECCRCANYLYRSHDNKIISAYNRFVVKSSEVSDYLVYENDELKQGFSGQPIDMEDTKWVD